MKLLWKILNIFFGAFIRLYFSLHGEPYRSATFYDAESSLLNLPGKFFNVQFYFHRNSSQVLSFDQNSI